MLRVVLPMRRHPDGVHAELGEAKTFTRKEELLPLLKCAGVTLHLVEVLNCDVWHNWFLVNGSIYTMRVVAPNENKISHRWRSRKWQLAAAA